MPVKQEIAAFCADAVAWRHELHAHPELAFEENRTADFVAARLESFGIAVHRGLAKTGVVGTLRAGRSARAIGLRADMDALPITEANDVAYRSRNEGKMHACGHDGHTAMLLAAARHLASTRRFDGTVYFIFQPAEELAGGGRVMIEEGLFDRFPAEAVFGMHNFPDLPPGEFGVRAGPIMAGIDSVRILVTGRGAHGAMPHLGIDPVVVGAEIVTAVQTVVSRSLDPIEAAVVSITQFHAGQADNVIPGEALLRGAIRAFRPDVLARVHERVRGIAAGVAAAHGASAECLIQAVYPPTINSEAETATAAAVAAEVVGKERVRIGIN
ncbi:MAG: amidohydrolase, partial [Alphaproteobacteria bacterium]|nr:amidohydrolase [Alphaproteobacteria bacterium]